MRSFSPDLISKIVSAYNEPGSTIRSVAKRIGVSKNIVQKYVTREREGLTNGTESRQSSREHLKISYSTAAKNVSGTAKRNSGAIL